MNRKLPSKNMGTSNLGWLESRFHFSFAEYVNYDNMNFGVVRVINNDIIHPNSGFGTHPHHDMEIITYVIDGELTHKDSMGNSETLRSGEVQYMSAGTGITHSEYNENDSVDLRLLQMWIIPPKKHVSPLYGSHKFTPTESENKILNIVSSQEGDAKIKIHQDINMYVSKIKQGTTLNFDIKINRQVYFVQIEGESNIYGEILHHGDAMEIVDETSLTIE
ncbi:MAG: pirin family protein, partial [Arcobacteraceae bacterium]